MKFGRRDLIVVHECTCHYHWSLACTLVGRMCGGWTLLVKNGVVGVYMLLVFGGGGCTVIGISLGVVPWKYPQCPAGLTGAYHPGVIAGLGVGWCAPVILIGANVVRRCGLAYTWFPVVKFRGMELLLAMGVWLAAVLLVVGVFTCVPPAVTVGD